MKMNLCEPFTKLRKPAHPKAVDTDGPRDDRRTASVAVRWNTSVPGAERASASVAAQICGTREPRWGPWGCQTHGRPTVRKAQFPSGIGRLPKANAGSRKARGNHNPPDRPDGPPEKALTGSMVCYPTERSNGT